MAASKPVGLLSVAVARDKGKRDRRRDSNVASVTRMSL